MKKITAFLLVLAMMFSLVSCGLTDDGDVPNNSGDDGTQDTEQNDPGSGSADTEGGAENDTTSGDGVTAADILKVYGFTEDDVTPAHFVSFEDERIDGGSIGDIGSTGFFKISIEKDATSPDDYNAWFEKIFAKMTEVSADGKLYKNYLMEEEATPLSELQSSVLWEIMPGFGPLFYYQDLSVGKRIIAFTARYDTENDVYTVGITLWGLAG